MVSCRVEGVRSLGWAWVLALGVGACAEGPQPDARAPCDLRAPACAAGMTCRVVADGARCLEQMVAPADRACAPGSCAPGEACLAVEGVLGCRPLCDPAGGEPMCAGEQVCGYALPVQGLGVCPASCVPGEGCGPDATCGPSPAVPYPICIATGPAGPGASCAAERCSAGLGCLVREGDDEARCAVLCTEGDPDGRCGRGQCTGEVVGVAGVRYCTEGG